MRTKYNRNFRIRIMLYTFISMVTAIICDFMFLIMCIRFGFLVREYGDAAARSLIGSTDIFYRLFGVSLTNVMLLLLILVGLFVFLLCFMILTRGISDYIDTILDSARKIADGDMEHRIQIRSNDEFSCIADSINRMADKVQLMRSNEQAAVQSKNELITNVAHDLRTPLTSIIGYIDILNADDGLTDDKRREYLKIAWEKAKKLEVLINDLFSLTRVGYSGMPMNLAEIDIIHMLEQEVEELYPTFEENNLICYFEPDVDSCIIQADGDQLIRVFDNLIGNAIRHGRYGKQVRIRTVTELGHIHVQVINYGTVIPEDSLPHIFDKFYKVDQSRQSSGGTGLGLAIAKSIVDSHGGRISAKSSFDGTIFEVVLPICNTANTKLMT